MDQLTLETISYFEKILASQRRNLSTAKKRGDDKAVIDISRKIKYYSKALDVLLGVVYFSAEWRGRQ